MFENGPSDRMQLTGVGELLPPGSCIVCGNGNVKEGYIRYGVSLEFEGELYTCWFCVVQAAEILGCLIPAEAKALRDIADEVAEQNAILRKELETANERLEAFDRIVSPVITDARRAGGILSSDTEQVTINEPPLASGSGDEFAGIQSESAESTKSTGPERTIRSSTSDASSAGIL